MSSVPQRFVGLTLYDVLAVERTASTEQIKKGYRRQALKLHPDHNHSAEANEEFGYLAHAHEVLSDSGRRALYDETGAHGVDGDDGGGGGVAGEQYWRSVFPQVTEEEIERFRVKYTGSEEELQDIKDAYQRYSGNVQHVLDSVPFADAESVPRICELLNTHCRARISKAQISKLVKKARQWEEDEAAELAELQQSGTEEQKAALGTGGDEHALAVLLQNKWKQDKAKHEDWLKGMEEKYAAMESSTQSQRGGRGKGRGRGRGQQQTQQEDEEKEEVTAASEPSEDAFREMAERMQRNRAAQAAAGGKKVNKATSSSSDGGSSRSHSTDSPAKKRRTRK